MSIDFEMNLNFGLLGAQVEAAMPIAIARAAEAVRGVAVARTPNQSGHLAGSAGVTTNGFGDTVNALIKYPGPYAAFQNRGMRADGTHAIRNRPAGGQTGFLTQTMQDQEQLALDVMADTISQLIG